MRHAFTHRCSIEHLTRIEQAEAVAFEGRFLCGLVSRNRWEIEDWIVRSHVVGLARAIGLAI